MRWLVGIFLALISALVGLIGLALSRLPAIIEVFGARHRVRDARVEAPVR